MKKIFMIMLVLLTIGVVFGFDNGIDVNNRSSKRLIIGVRNGSGPFVELGQTFPGTTVYSPGWSGVTYDIIAVVGTNLNLRIPGYYEIQTHTIEWGYGQDNSVNFYFSHLDPVDPGEPGQNQ